MPEKVCKRCLLAELADQITEETIRDYIAVIDPELKVEEPVYQDVYKRQVVNYVTASELFHMGAKRVVLARELSLEDISRIREKTPPELEIEVFVHGAMCVSFSGRCLLSNYMTGRDANRGECAQPCRWSYHLVEEKRPGQYYQISEEEHGTYTVSYTHLDVYKRQIWH